MARSEGASPSLPAFESRREFGYRWTMIRAEALSEIASRADALKARGAASAFLFGSTARGDATPDSDIDLFIDLVPGRKFSLVDLAGIQRFLEGELKVPVDVTTRGSLHPLLRADIEREAVRAF
jgi:uncharacterized protein